MSRNFLAKHHQVSEQNLMDKANVSGPVAGTINLTIGERFVVITGPNRVYRSC